MVCVKFELNGFGLSTPNVEFNMKNVTLVKKIIWTCDSASKQYQNKRPSWQFRVVWSFKPFKRL